MLEALQQAIDLLKDTQLSETELSPTPSMEATPPPRDLQDARRDTRDTVVVSEMSERVQYVYVHVYVYMYCTCIYIYMCMYTCTVHVHVCICTCVCRYMQLYSYMHVTTAICMQGLCTFQILCVDGVEKNGERGR